MRRCLSDESHNNGKKVEYYMAIKPKCDKCGKEFKEFGAILLSPPNKQNTVKKFHLCKVCYGEIRKKLQNKKG